MIIRNSAIAAVTAVAVLFSFGAHGATRQEAMAAKNAARSGQWGEAELDAGGIADGPRHGEFPSPM